MIRDLTKEGKFGRLTPIERIPKYKNHSAYYKCICDCGEEVLVPHGNLVSGITKSCGCLRKEITGNHTRIHGYSKEKLYLVWKAMKKRCYSQNDKHYKWYGSLGVKVCEEWKGDYCAFRKWAYENGYKSEASYSTHTVDRINPYGDYEPTNCRIVDWKTQRHNRRTDFDRRKQISR